MREENIRIILIEKALNFAPNAIIARQQISKNMNTGIPIDGITPNFNNANS
jgi:hypothetical protein